MLDVRRLRVLQEVVERGSFSGAAESLHLSQSAVSQQIAVLEKEVGIPLLQRTSEGPKLTAAGEALMGHGDAVMCRLEEAERELAQIAGLEGGRLRLASFPTASATLMTKALSIFRQRFPNIELHFTEQEPEDSSRTGSAESCRAHAAIRSSRSVATLGSSRESASRARSTR
jgi:DNA-binding transcriptional LysR family regulator